MFLSILVLGMLISLLQFKLPKQLFTFVLVIFIFIYIVCFIYLYTHTHTERGSSVINDYMSSGLHNQITKLLFSDYMITYYSQNSNTLFIIYSSSLIPLFHLLNVPL